MTPPVATNATTGGRSATPLVRAEQDAAMALARASGTPWATIAADFGLSRSQVHRRVKAHLEAAESPSSAAAVEPTPTAATLLGTDGLQVVVELEAAMTRAVHRFDRIAEESAHDGYKIAATRQGLETRVAHLQLMQQVGVVPRTLRAYRDRADVSRALAAYGDLLRRHDVPDEAIREMDAIAQSLRDKNTDFFTALGRPLTNLGPGDAAATAPADPAPTPSSGANWST